MAELYPYNKEYGKGALIETHLTQSFTRYTPISVPGARRTVNAKIEVSPIGANNSSTQTKIATTISYIENFNYEWPQPWFAQYVINGKETYRHSGEHPMGAGEKKVNYIVANVEPKSDGTFGSVIYKYTCLRHGFINEDINLSPYIPSLFYTNPTARINSFGYDRESLILNYNITYGHNKYFIENESGHLPPKDTDSHLRITFANGDTYTFPLRANAANILTQDKTITDDIRHIKAGELIQYELFLLATNGKTNTIKGTYQIPATVHNIKIYDLDLAENSAATKLPYALINNEKATNFAVPGVTFSGNNDYVATIDQNGIVTPHHAGSVTFTIRSHDDIGGNVTVSKTFYIRPLGGFPFGPDAEQTDYLSAEIANRVISACQQVAAKQQITIQDITTFRGYTTKVREVRDVVYKINANVKTIADAKRITYDAEKLTFSETNTNEEWYYMTNEWLRLMPLFKPYA